MPDPTGQEAALEIDVNEMLPDPPAASSSEQNIEGQTPEAGGGEEPAEPEGNGEGNLDDHFYSGNPNELPEDLQPIYKSMQADYTRKTQELAENRKTSGESTYKAELWDKMMADPGFQGLLNQRNQLQQAAPEGQPSLTDVDYSDPKVFEQWMNSKVENMLQQRLQPMQTSLQRQQIGAEMEMMGQRYPDFNDRRASIADYYQANPQSGASMEDVYKIVTYQDAQKRGQQEAYQSMQRKKAATTEVPSAPTATPGTSQMMTLDESLAAAFRKAGHNV